MLYVTTRNKNDAHTSHKTLTVDRASDGGLFVPFQIPSYSKEDICALKNKSFGQIMADILNLFFSARLDGWDVDFAVGRYPVRLVPLGRRIVVAETWHNPDWDFTRMVRNLSGRILGNDDTQGMPSCWAWVAIRIATLFALYGEMLRQGIIDPDKAMDVAVAEGDFSAPLAVWYAREMGLPVSMIIASCKENSGTWELLHHGQLRRDEDNQSAERLVYVQLGQSQVNKLLEGKTYAPDEESLAKLRRGIFTAVVSDKRIASVINNVYRTSTYLLEPNSALAYGGLQDYLSAAGETRVALLLTERSPLCSADAVADAMGISVKALKELIQII